VRKIYSLFMEKWCAVRSMLYLRPGGTLVVTAVMRPYVTSWTERPRFQL